MAIPLVYIFFKISWKPYIYCTFETAEQNIKRKAYAWFDAFLNMWMIMKNIRYIFQLPYKPSLFITVIPFFSLAVTYLGRRRLWRGDCCVGRVCTERPGSSPSLEIWCHNPTPAPEWATRTRAGLSQIFPAKADCKQSICQWTCQWL